MKYSDSWNYGLVLEQATQKRKATEAETERKPACIPDPEATLDVPELLLVIDPLPGIIGFMFPPGIIGLTEPPKLW